MENNKVTVNVCLVYSFAHQFSHSLNRWIQQVCIDPLINSLIHKRAQYLASNNTIVIQQTLSSISLLRIAPK